MMTPEEADAAQRWAGMDGAAGKPFCRCGDEIVAADPGLCGTCAAMKLDEIERLRSLNEALSQTGPHNSPIAPDALPEFFARGGMTEALAKHRVAIVRQCANEILRLRTALEESQAREAKLRTAVKRSLHNQSNTLLHEVVRLPSDDTALREMIASERAACIAICDELEQHWSDYKDVALRNAASGEPRAARAIADAIRSRG